MKMKIYPVIGILAIVGLIKCGSTDDTSCFIQVTGSTEGADQGIRAIPAESDAKRAAQSFIPVYSGTGSTNWQPTSFQVYLINNGELATGTVTAEITTTTVGGTTAVAASNSIATEDITSSGGFHTFTIAAAENIFTSTTKYWIVLTGTYTASDSAYISWGMEDSSSFDSSSDGEAVFESTLDSFDNISPKDFAFKIGCTDSENPDSE